jgi:hypothetical protein
VRCFLKRANSEVWRQRIGLSAGRASTRTLSPISGKNRTSSRTAGEILICGRLVQRLWDSGGANVANLRPNVAILYRREEKRQRSGLCGGQTGIRTLSRVLFALVRTSRTLLRSSVQTRSPVPISKPDCGQRMQRNGAAGAAVLLSPLILRRGQKPRFSAKCELFCRRMLLKKRDLDCVAEREGFEPSIELLTL